MGLEQLDTLISFAVVMLLLSLQITILVQMAVAVFGLRGRNLQWGLERLLNQVDPNLGAHATEIAKRVLQHPALAHSGGFGGRLWEHRRATAVRVEELHRVLDDLAKNPGSPLDQTVKRVLQTAVGTTVAGRTPELAENASALVSELTSVLPAHKPAIEAAVNRAITTAKKLEGEVNSWFDTIMDRTTERFVLRTRWITALFAIGFAFFLHIDSLQILKQLSSNSALRAQLVQGAESTLKQAGTVVENTKAPKPLASIAIGATKDDMEDKSDAARLARAPGNLVTHEAGETWLKNTFTDPVKAAKVLAAYNKRFQEATIGRIKELDTSFQQVKQALEGTSLVIVPSPFPGYRSYGQLGNLHLLGTLMSALLLGLGAPFWFNALRQLASLRPMLARKVEQKKTESEQEVVGA